MIEPTWISLVPPLLAIALAIWTRQVYLSLGAGIWIGWAIVEFLTGTPLWKAPFSGAARAIDETVAVLGNEGDAKVILFTLVIGALIAVVEVSGGVQGFVTWLEDRKWVTNGRRAQVMTYLLGFVIFIESNITVLVRGAIGRPLFDRYRVSREKLAFIVDASAAAVCVMIPLNAWGAYILGVLNQLDVERPLDVFIAAVPQNFYAIGILILAAIVAFTGWDVGPMKRAEKRTREGKLLWDDATPLIDPDVLAPEHDPSVKPHPMNMIVPIVAMVLAMPVAMVITGDGDIRAGSGSTSVLWAVLFALVVAWVMLLWQKAYSIDDLTKTSLKGAGGLVGMALVLLLAIALASVAQELGTGAYIARLTADVLPPYVFLPLVFLVAASIAFSIGSSWGTFAIMLPIAVPAAATLGLPLPPFVAASLAGGIFGDHSSPISDTTIIASMASATDHIDHVRTQLPYALTAGAVAIAAFAIAGAGLVAG